MPVLTAPATIIVSITDKIGVECELDFLLHETPTPRPGSWEAQRIRELDEALRRYYARKLVPLPMGEEW